MIFRQLFDADSSTYTYLLGDQESKDAVIIDPVLEHVASYLTLISELGLNLKFMLNTHCHADHITGTGKLKESLPEAKSAISKTSTAKADMLLQDNQILKFATFDIKCIATPGHTEGCISFYVEKKGLLFTGDTLMIRGCGRTDFQGGSSAILFDSVHTRLFTLPLETLVYPAHDYKGRTCSSILEEKNYNPRLTKTKQEFIVIMEGLGLSYPKKMDVAVSANLRCGL